MSYAYKPRDSKYANTLVPWVIAELDAHVPPRLDTRLPDRYYSVHPD